MSQLVVYVSLFSLLFFHSVAFPQSWHFSLALLLSRSRSFPQPNWLNHPSTILRIFCLFCFVMFCCIVLHVITIVLYLRVQLLNSSLRSRYWYAAVTLKSNKWCKICKSFAYEKKLKMIIICTHYPNTSDTDHGKSTRYPMWSQDEDAPQETAMGPEGWQQQKNPPTPQLEAVAICD